MFILQNAQEKIVIKKLKALREYNKCHLLRTKCKSRAAQQLNNCKIIVAAVVAGLTRQQQQ